MFAVFAEITAELGVWPWGPPADVGEEYSHFETFIRYESIRLGYWSLIVLAIALIGLSLIRRLGWAPGYFGSVVLTLGTLIAADVIASVFFWKSLSRDETYFLGWSDLWSFVEEHVISWSVVSVLWLGLWYVIFRKARASPSLT